MNYMENLSKEDLITICGGDDFTRDFGMLCGSIARAIVDGAKVIAYNIASQQGAPEAWR
ncbi:hypothetical protein [uncultured Bacteroides sp.]|uniref:hypothetical protein n=1 Tax=uncultured Bacteroides sp. TaxID=162156 RepID=UPI0025F98D0A|nr:hypothetical protein [uncultured Bacteroides sp.]